MTPLQAELTHLGEMTTFEVADELRHAGVKGRRNQPFACPVATYLAARVKCDTVSVGRDEAVAYGRDVQVCSLPHSVAMFVFAFDAGGWPELAL